MKQIIVQIDGGYLRSTARTQGQRYNPDFIERLAKSLTIRDEEIVRILYYDCAPFKGARVKPISGNEHVFDGVDAWLHDLASRDLFAVRRGVLKWRGWRIKGQRRNVAALTDDDFEPNFEQKGVDLRIGLDIVAYSEPRLVDRIILVAGDTDLIPAMKLARRRAVQIVGVELPRKKLTREMLAHVDMTRIVEWPV